MRRNYEIQGRIIQRAGAAIIRDEARLSTADSHDGTVCAARAFAADGFTTWIFMVESGTGGLPVYQLADTLRPAAPAPPHQRPASGRFLVHRARLGRVA